jgi:hypothetical protein
MNVQDGISMGVVMYEGLEAFKGIVEQIVYAFYRYEINSGMRKLEMLTSQVTKFLTKYQLDSDQLEEINRLLQMILLAVEKKDFLIAADLLKYELLERVLLVSETASNGERI